MVSNTMHFCIPTSSWHVTQQQSGSSYSKSNCLLSCDSWLWSSGYTTYRYMYKCPMLLDYTSKWSRDVQVHCIGRQNFFSLLLASLLTLVFFFKRMFSNTCTIHASINPTNFLLSLETESNSFTSEQDECSDRPSGLTDASRLWRACTWAIHTNQQWLAVKEWRHWNSVVP